MSRTEPNDLKPLWKDLPQLPLSERDTRWTNIKTKMEEQGIACLVIWGTGRCEHIRYVSQLGTHGVVLFPLNGEPVVFTDMLHLGRYARACQNWITDVREDVENFPKALKGFGFEKGTYGIVSGTVPHTRLPRHGTLAGATMLQSALPDAKLVEATHLFEELEMIKSPFEIALLEKAAGIAYDVFEAMVRAARSGATDVFGGKGGILHDHFLGQIPETCLEENMVFGQNIDIHNPNWNPNAGLMLGDTIWVTKEGPNKLTRVPVELTVV